MNKILIIEDDSNIVRLEKDYLEANGYETEFATDGNEGLKLALENQYQLILLDIMLPGVDGLQICKNIRETKDTPIILVSAKRTETDKITGLGFGADDYIVKPFSPGELVARVNAHINRFNRLTTPTVQNENVIERDNIKLNRDTGDAWVNNIQLNLTKKEFDVLFLMAKKPEAVFSKNQLFEEVWGYDSLGDTSTLTVHINRLRDKLKEADPDRDYIKTVWGRGYRFM